MKVKFSVCADYHLHPQYPIGPEGIEKIVDRAIENDVDAMLHCGDFIIDLKGGENALNTFLHNKAGIPAFGCYGNHELEMTDSIETLNKAYGVENSYYYRDLKGFRFVVTDTNHFVYDGVFKRYPGFSVGGPSWDYDFNMLGEKQLYWLKETLMNSPYPCIVLGHTCFANESGSCKDSAKVREIFREVNAAHKGRVLLCLNGHYHTDSTYIVDDVAYFNVNTCYMGAWSPNKHDLFPKEFKEKYASSANCAFFKEPLSAIVTVDSEGIIDIEGMKTEYLYDVTPEKMGLPLESNIGLKVPYISDSHIELFK